MTEIALAVIVVVQICYLAIWSFKIFGLIDRIVIMAGEPDKAKVLRDAMSRKRRKGMKPTPTPPPEARGAETREPEMGADAEKL